MSREELPDHILSIFPLFRHKLHRRHPKSVIPRQQMDVLHKIKFHPGKPMSFYCEKAVISRPNMTKVVNQLIDGGMVERKRDPDDRRIVTLDITEKGEKVVKAFFKDLKEQIYEATKVLSDEDVDALINSFVTIKTIFEKMDNASHED